MADRYNPQEIEKKWQKRWLDEKVFKADDASPKPKYYQLETFPYPSGAGLHVGHPKGYIAEDIHARYTRMRGREVLYTMGWDAFGLPTENYALKVNKSPQEVTIENTDHFREQVRMFGFSYDWDREINTSSPDYYKWTQWLFIQMFKKGLAYRAKAKVNWCPKDQTIIANEQVINGLCERCGSPIEERLMEQWMLRITDYAERLLSGLQGLDWPAATVKRQEDWIGKSEGAELSFALNFKKDPNANDWRDADGTRAAIAVFTTRPDTLFGATYLVLAPEHPWVTLALNGKHDVLDNADEVKAYVAAAAHKTDLMRQEAAKEKTGVELKGVTAVNPATQEEVPVWVADYVLGSYGTGAIMAVPAHDERDFAFAKEFGLPIKQVVAQETGIAHPDDERRDGGCAVIFDPETQKYAVAKHPNGPILLFAGGVDDGEDLQQGILREIAEESGLHDFQHVERIRSCFTHFYNRRRQVHRSALATCFLAVLKSRDAKPTKLEAHEQGMELAWMTADEIMENWRANNENHDVDHWMIFFREAAGRAIELGYDRTTRGDEFRQESFSGGGILIDSGKFSGMDSEAAKWEITKLAGGTRMTQYKLRDWSVSRQRYWGVPIPMVHCEQCGIVPVPDSDLPVILPVLANYRPQGVAPLASDPEYINVKCPQCGGAAKRDPETFDTFVDSSWYYLRYPDPHNSAAIFDKAKTKHWMPVDLYIIGAEHTVLHLLYSRFVTKFLHDEGWLDFDEPFLKLRHQGLIRGADGQKMSKSKGNVVNPDELIAEFGADTVRLYEMFMGPFEDGAPWDPKGILGVNRFLMRFWRYVTDVMEIQTKHSWEIATSGVCKPVLHRTIKKVGDDIEVLKFNTAISSLMILLNALYEVDEKGGTFSVLEKKDLAALIKLLHPLAPHMAQELWSRMGGTTWLDFEAWPEYDPRLIIEETVMLVFQVNGKLKDTVAAAADITEEAAKEMALANAKVKSALNGQPPKRVVYVDKKLVNIVI